MYSIIYSTDFHWYVRLYAAVWCKVCYVMEDCACLQLTTVPRIWPYGKQNDRWNIPVMRSLSWYSKGQTSGAYLAHFFQGIYLMMPISSLSHAQRAPSQDIKHPGLSPVTLLRCLDRTDVKLTHFIVWKETRLHDEYWWEKTSKQRQRVKTDKMVVKGRNRLFLAESNKYARGK